MDLRASLYAPETRLSAIMQSYSPLTTVVDNNGFEKKILHAYMLAGNCSTQNATVPERKSTYDLNI